MPRSLNKQSRHAAALLVTLLAVAGSAHAAEITQTVNSTANTSEWSDAVWGTPAAAATSGNTYVTAPGFFAAGATSLGSAATVTGRIRAYAATGGSGTFGGDSLRLVANTELLVKEAGSYSANLILDGGVFRLAPDAAASASFGGTVQVLSNSIIGVVQANSTTFTIDSSFTGSANVRLAGGNGSSNSLIFSDTSDFSGFTGTLFIGGGGTTATPRPLTVSFGTGSHNLSGSTLNLNNSGTTTDILNLGGSISVSALVFGATTVGDGLYTAATLNTLLGSTQFTGLGTLQVGAIPEPSTYAMVAGMAAVALVGVKRRRQG